MFMTRMERRWATLWPTFLIEAHLVVELKACSTLLTEHTAQMLGYLRASRLRRGMLINFGAPRLQIKKLIL